LTGSVVSGYSPTSSSFKLSLTQADDYFSLGVITFTSGVNSGAKRTIKLHKSRVLTLSYPFEEVPAIGDSFSICPGCDKTRNGGCQKFSNQANFLGFPYIPNPDTVT
jgi:uncharacterized phage protein (TIGR02218 family)